MLRLLCLSIFLFLLSPAKGCSILYYIDSLSGKIYALNHEDYWYDVKPYLQIMPADKGKLARLWYGWDNFAQGGINEAGLFFDGAATPEQLLVAGSHPPKTNLGDELLAQCKNVDEALQLLENKKIALTNGHLLLGDAGGKAVVVEWVNGKKEVVLMWGYSLMVTNFLLNDTTAGNYPCPRYEAMQQEIHRLEMGNDTLSFLQVANIMGKSVQLPAKDANGREAGTLYSSFIDITDMKLVLVYKLDNTQMVKLDLREEFAKGKKQKIRLG